MTKKIKKGYDWVEEQQDNWDSIVAEKLEQLDTLSQSHLDWFTKHATVSTILAWKRPVIESKKNFIAKEKMNAQPKQNALNDIPPLEDSAETIVTVQNTKHNLNIKVEKVDSKLSQTAVNDTSSVDCPPSDFEESQQMASNEQGFDPQQSRSKENDSIESDVALEPIELVTSIDKLKNQRSSNLTSNMQVDTSENVVIPDTTQPQNNTSKRTSSSSTASDGNLTVHTPDLVVDLDSQQTQTQKAPKTPESYAHIEIEEVRGNFKLDNDLEKHNVNSLSCYNDEFKDEELNEVDDEIQLVVSNRDTRKDEAPVDRPDQNPIPLPIAQPIISPPRNIAHTILSSPVRHKSPFMSRLFQVGSAKDLSLKEDSPSPIDFVTTRPKSSASTSSINSEFSNRSCKSLLQNRMGKRPPEPVSAQIEVSDAMPCTQFKKPKVLTKKQTTDVAKNIPESQTNDSEKQEKVEKSGEEENMYEIPSWAEGEELYSHIRNQAGLDPDAIFGRMTPVYLEEIFSKEHMTKIPEQAP